MTLLVLITGTGRSGTSTIAGALHHAGLHVPGPHLGPNRSNPKGFFESRWAIQFHQDITTSAGINDYDARPEAIDLARRAITPELRGRLRDFLAQESAGHEAIVVKDPRSVWAQSLWREAAEEVGLGIRYLTMLRHPAEVVGSRATYYVDADDAAERQRFETYSVARWVNSSLVSERETRGQRRSFVPYADLLTDWRPVLARLGQELDLRYAVDPGSREHTDVDDFIEPDLRRHQPDWSPLHVPDRLRDLAQGVWDDLEVLTASAGRDDAAERDLDQRAATYVRLFAEAVEAAAIAHDAAGLHPPDRITPPGGRKRKGGKGGKSGGQGGPDDHRMRPPRLDRATVEELEAELQRRSTAPDQS